VQEGVLLGSGREGEQVCAQGWPGGFSGEPRNVVVDSIEFCHNLGSDELFGRDVKAVGVAQDRLESRAWVVELAQQAAGGNGRFIAGNDLLQRLGRRARCNRVRSDEGVGVASPTTWR
jgi:hypothetical protein